MKEYIIWDYWIIGNQYYCIYYKAGKLYFSATTSEIKNKEDK